MKTRKEKKKSNAGYWIAIILFAAMLVLCVRSISSDRLGKLEMLLNEYYYSQEKLDAAMRDTLGDVYEEGSYANFDNYIYKLVFEDINELEPEEIGKYNTVFSRERTKEVSSSLSTPGETAVSVSDGVCVIKLSDFTNGYTREALMEHETVLRENRDFIIDMRGNTGGHTQELVRVLSLFYDEGTTVYTEISDELKEHKASGGKVIDFDSIVFLCDRKTASSAEVMMFNLRSDFPDKVSVVGTKTTGKYFAYVYDEFDDGHSIVMVTLLMGNSRGETFDKNGIVPDIDAQGDECMTRALELLKEE